MKIKKISISVIIILLILAFLAFLAYPFFMYYFYPGDHTTFHAAFTVDGKPYTPQLADFCVQDDLDSNPSQIPSSFHANSDGTVDFALHEGAYGGRNVAMRIDGMEEPLLLLTGSASNNEIIRHDIQVDVDTKTKTAYVTGHYTYDDEPSHALFARLKWHTVSINETLDLTAYPRQMPHIARTF